MGRQRKTIRLAPAVYATAGQYFSVTLGTHDRQRHFEHAALAGRVFALTVQGALRRDTHLSAACLMPDHLHLLIAPTTESLVSVLKRWKNYTTTVARREFGIAKLWQRSFYDHALRRDEDLHTVARYILANPLRAGLVTDWRDYPYSWCEWEL